MQFVRFWFDKEAQGQLASLSREIRRVEEQRIREALWCSFSRLIIAKQSGASLARDLSHSRPHRAFERAPAMPFSKFLTTVERVASNSLDLSASVSSPDANVFQGDARSLPIPDESVDLVVTSPPYLNAIDYMRTSKFSLIWMGYTVGELRRLRSTMVGAEGAKNTRAGEIELAILSQLRLRPRLQDRQEAILGRYISDMLLAIEQVGRVLKSGGRAVYVVGENTIGGTFVPNALLAEKVAELVGLKLIDRSKRDLPANRRYLPPPSSSKGREQLDGRMRREVVLTFTKIN